MTFDLDLWPTDLNINRGHLLIKDYLPTKFEASWAKHSWVMSCTRLRDTDIPTDRHTDRHTDRPTYRPTCAKQYAPPFSKGGINIKAPSLRIKKLWPMLKFFKSRSKVTVKVTCSKFMIPSERSCHKEHSCQIWKPYLLRWKSYTQC